MNPFAFFADIGNYDDRVVAREMSPSGVQVSTAYTSDCGYETALLDSNGTHPVERYADKDSAEVGHKKWLAFAENASGKEVTKLGWPGLVEDETIVISAPN